MSKTAKSRMRIVGRLCLSAGSGVMSKCCSSSDCTQGGLKPRHTWSNKLDFLLAVVGSCAGLGNVWRFPYLCYKNGGGAFLIPYLISVLLGGIPMFFLEVSLGQFMAAGGMEAWRLVPIFKGIGVASAVVVFLMNLYYNVILGWTLHYMFATCAAFGSQLPWTTCDNWWNTARCGSSVNTTVVSASVQAADGVAADLYKNVTMVTVQSTVDPVTEYWERKVLRISSGIDVMGAVQWDLALCLLLAWIVVYFCIFKGVKLSGKVIYFTATFPYLIMLALLIRACTLPGAIDGIKFYIIPKFDQLARAEVWAEAGTQIVYSYSISMGTLTALGSYNKFKHNCFKDTILFSTINTTICFFAGFAVFATLGFMAHQHNADIMDVAEQGPGLAFITYPKAVAEMPGSQFWGLLFFIMIFLLGLDSQFTCVEGFVTAVVDQFPKQLRRGYRREMFIAVTCLFSFFVGLPMVTNGGMYVFQLFDYYTANTTFPLITFCECVAISWVYGIGRYFEHMELMIGYRFPNMLKYLWVLLTPAFTLVVFVNCVISYSAPTYNQHYLFPAWSVGLGWTLSLSSFVMIPLVALYTFCQAKNKDETVLECLVKLRRGELTDKQLGTETPEEKDGEELQPLSKNTERHIHLHDEEDEEKAGDEKVEEKVDLVKK